MDHQPTTRVFSRISSRKAQRRKEKPSTFLRAFLCAFAPLREKFCLNSASDQVGNIPALIPLKAFRPRGIQFGPFGRGKDSAFDGFESRRSVFGYQFVIYEFRV